MVCVVSCNNSVFYKENVVQWCLSRFAYYIDLAVICQDAACCVLWSADRIGLLKDVHIWVTCSLKAPKLHFFSRKYSNRVGPPFYTIFPLILHILEPHWHHCIDTKMWFNRMWFLQKWLNKVGPRPAGVFPLFQM